MNRFSNFFTPFFVFVFLVTPIVSSAQQTGTYSHSQVTETSAVISGKVTDSNLLSLGFVILFGSTQGLLLNVAPIFPDVNGNYSVTLNNLRAGTTYYYQMVYGLSATAMGQVKNFKTDDPVLDLSHKRVDQLGAILYGDVTPGHPNFIIKYGDTTAINDGTFSLDIDSMGKFEDYFAPGFPPNTTVYYRAVDPLLPIAYSPLKSFKTLEEKVTLEFKQVTAGAFTAYGTVSPDVPPIKVLVSATGLLGLEFENEPQTLGNNWEASFLNLQANKTYYVRVAKRDDITFTYLIKTVKTESADINLQFFNITSNSMKVSGKIPFGTESVLLCFATNEVALATSPDCGSGPLFEAVEGSSAFETTVTNLAANTTYYFKVRNSTNTNDLSSAFSVSTFPTEAPSNPPTNIELELPTNLVPCDGLDCDFNRLMELANNVIDFLLKTVALPLFAILFAYVGWLYMTSADNPGNRSKAKGIMISSVFGFVIAMAAFIIIKTILVSLGYEGINFLAF